MKKDFIYHGIRVGTHEFVPEKVLDKLKKECVEPGLNFVRFSLGGECFSIDGQPIDLNYFREWAKYMADNKVYFAFQTSDRFLQENIDIVREMKEIAGEYYLCNFSFGEIGSRWGCVGSEYGVPNPGKNLAEAKQHIMDTVSSMLSKATFEGQIPKEVIPTSTVEATCLLPYVITDDYSIPCLETMCGNPEIMIPMLRATAKVNKSEFWATYIAHEWYGGVRCLDPLKLRRLKLIYDYAYMCGSSLFVLESGDECLYAHDLSGGRDYDTNFHPLTDTECGFDHPAVVYYRNILKNFADFIKKDERPAGGPKVKVAFVQGNLDGFSLFRGGSSLWNCFDNKDFGYSTPEFVWRIFDDIATKRTWCDVDNYGEVDLSGAPAYGQYDVVQATAGYEVFSKYDYIIFTGWNTMTDEIYENLKKFVQGGGKLFMTAAHLNTSVNRNGEIKLYNDGKVADLFGCDLDAENALNINHGFKFEESIVPGVLYPADMKFDPLMAEGYINYAKVTLNGGASTGKLSQSFVDRDIDSMPIWLTENKCGEGYAILMTTLDYPSAGGYTPYRTIVRELISASHRAADVKVYGGDKLRFAVYEGNKIYLLNTDFDCKIEAIVDYGTEKKSFILEPLEFKVVEPIA